VIHVVSDERSVSGQHIGPTDPELGALLERFEVDPASERAVSRLRLTAAVLAGLGAIAMLLSTLPFTMLLIAILALLVSAGWIAKSRTIEQRARTPEQHYLALHARGLMLCEGGSLSWVPWECVTHIEVDEERLDIVLERSTEPPLRLEPRYPGVEIYTLMNRLRNAWRGTNDQ
jgi:hypothetical protein